MHWLDISIFLFIIITIFIIGLKNRIIENTNYVSFVLSGRTLSLPAFVATLVSTWYGGILGVAENTYYAGIQTWLIFGCPYYIFALLFAIFLATSNNENMSLF